MPFLRGKTECQGQFSIWPSVREIERSNPSAASFDPLYPSNARLTCHSSLAFAALGYGDVPVLSLAARGVESRSAKAGLTRMNCNTYAQRVDDQYTTQAYRERLGAFAKLIDDFLFILSFVGKDAGRDPEWWDTHLLSYTAHDIHGDILEGDGNH
jgi:hypothetical protein